MSKGKAKHPTVVTIKCELEVEVDALLVEDAKRAALDLIERGLVSPGGEKVGVVVLSIEDVRDA